MMSAHGLPNPNPGVSAPRAPGSAPAVAALKRAFLARLADAFLGTGKRSRARLAQWAITLIVYVCSAAIMALGVAESQIAEQAFAGWCVFVVLGLVGGYTLIRGPWSERLSDSGVNEAQIVFGLATVLWAYLICGPWRGATLFPLMLILTFGAFSSSWRRLAALTVIALAGLAAAIAVLHELHPRHFDFRADIANLLVLAVMLPACSVVAARLSSLRARLHGQRDALAMALAEMHRLSTRDEVTGLKNHRRMQELLELEHRRSVRSGRTFCLAVIDLEDIAPVASAGNGMTGDPLLRAFADEALGAIRSCDMLGRWEEDQFLLMMPDTRASLARLGVDRLRDRTETIRLDAANAPAAITISAGVVEHIAGESVGDAVARATRALQAAKAQGRNRVVAG
ncbi:GGDEF domain-containing protein [soil metagenome]